MKLPKAQIARIDPGARAAEAPEGRAVAETHRRTGHGADTERRSP